MGRVYEALKRAAVQPSGVKPQKPANSRRRSGGAGELPPPRVRLKSS